MRFTAPETGIYTVDVEATFSSTDFTLWVSTPKTVQAVVDGGPVAVTSDVPGQSVDVEFDVSAGQTFTVNDKGTTGGPSEQLVGPSGTEQAPWLPGLNRYHEGVYRADAAGASRYRYIPRGGDVSDEAYVVSATLLEGVVDGPDLTATVDVPGRVVLIPFDLLPGESATVGTDSDHYATEVETFDADTGIKRTFQESGRHVVAVSARDRGIGSATVQIAFPLEVPAVVGGPRVAVDTSSYFRRAVHVGFTGEAGQVITVDQVETSGHWTGGTAVLGPYGQTIPQLSGVRPVWRLPVSGEYQFRSVAASRLVGSVALAAVDQVTMPADGATSTVTVDAPREMVLVRIPVAVGTRLGVTLEQVDASFGDTWDVRVNAPDGYRYNSSRQERSPISPCASPGTSMSSSAPTRTHSARSRCEPPRRDSSRALFAEVLVNATGCE